MSQISQISVKTMLRTIYVVIDQNRKVEIMSTLICYLRNTGFVFRFYHFYSIPSKEYTYIYIYMNHNLVRLYPSEKIRLYLFCKY